MANTRGMISAGLIVEAFKYVAVFLVILVVANSISSLFTEDSSDDTLSEMYNAMTLVTPYKKGTGEGGPGSINNPSREIRFNSETTDPVTLSSREAIIAFSGDRDIFIEAPPKSYQSMYGFYMENPDNCVGDNCICFCDELRFTTLTREDVMAKTIPHTILQETNLGGRAYCAKQMDCQSITQRVETEPEITDIPVISFYPTRGFSDSECNVFGPGGSLQVMNLIWRNGFIIHSPFGANLYNPNAENPCPYTTQTLKAGFTYNFYEGNNPSFAAVRDQENNNILQVYLNALEE